MISTQQLLGALATLLPNDRHVEDRLRRLIRSGRVTRPRTLAGNYIRTRFEMKELARELEIDLASIETKLGVLDPHRGAEAR